MFRPVVPVPRFPGVAVGGSLGSSSPGFLETHSPGTPDFGVPFPVAFCGMADAACSIPGGDVSDKGCTFQCGWASNKLKSVVVLLPC